MRRLIYAVLLFTLFFSPTLAAKRVALVIGNSDYKFVTDLVNPANDANVMESALKDAGFEVIRKNDLDRRGMMLALEDFGGMLKQGVDASMFYYAGHGIEVDGTNYLVPIDSNMQNNEDAEAFNVSVNSYLTMIEKSGVPFNILVLDACRNNPFAKLKTNSKGLAPILAPVGTYIAYSTAPGSVALDGEGKNSPFTDALTRSIGFEGLRLEDVFKETRAQVFAATKGQQTTYDSSAIVGTFYFREPIKPGLKQTTLAPPTGKIIHVKPVDGDFYGSIVQAVKDAKAGDRIELAPGVYDGNITITKPIEIVGPGNSELVTLRGFNKHTVNWKATGGLIANVTIKQLVGSECGNQCNAVYVAGGTLTIQNSNLTSEDGPVVGVEGKTANLTFRNNIISNAREIGILFSASSKGLVEESDIFSNGDVGIDIVEAAKVTIRNSAVHDGKAIGIIVANKAVAIIEGNKITGNDSSGISIFTEGVGQVQNNTITNNRDFGVEISLGGTGTFKNNDLRSNAQGSWKILDHAGKVIRESNSE
jgi:parallel beta-helix repeat protein